MRRQFDWNFRVNAWGQVSDMPQSLMVLSQSITVKFGENTAGRGIIELPHLMQLNPGSLRENIRETRLKSSVTIPIVGTLLCRG